MKEVLVIDSDQERALELKDFLEKKAPSAPIIDDVDDYVDCCIRCEIRPVGRYAPILVDSVDEGLEVLKASGDLKVVLLNVASPEMNGLDALKKIKRDPSEVIVIVVGADGETARGAGDLGALDVAPKTPNMDIDYMENIHRMLDRAFCRLYARDKIFQTPAEDTEEGAEARFHLVGESKPMIALNKEIGRVARDTSPVLIAGETGTGKELVARLIHEGSGRPKKLFTSIDCGAVPETLLESELFGYDKGAFTNAAPEGRLGRFRLADGGTLFLDEIGNTTAELQKRLLRVLQTQEIQPVGGDQTYKVDVRIIAATNQDLAQLVRDAEFREDLFYRLKGYEITLAPLRKREGDIALLVPYFLQQVQAREGRRMPRISEKAMELLENYDWPGNVRELEHCLKSAAVSSHGEVILPEDLPQEIRTYSGGGGTDSGGGGTEGDVQERQSSETVETPTYETLFDLSVVVFCQFISEAESITETDITNWSKVLDPYTHRRITDAEHEIYTWRQAWKKGRIKSADVLSDIEEVVKAAVTRLSALRYGSDAGRTATEPISIEGRTLSGSLIAVLHEMVKEYGDDRKKAARMLKLDPKTLDGWVGKDVARERSKVPLSKLKSFPDREVESLLTKPVDYFVAEQLSRPEWRVKGPDERIRAVHLALKSVSGRLSGDHGCIYFGGMTFEQIERQIYRRAAYLYSDETEAAEALGVGVRTFRKHWSRSESAEAFPEHYTLF
ncbi:hypothetical protein C6499_10550 [Candidatus Poribacteria bacterium]|nr:MAG: hypothetical protein C6499_10550 [Candidatus Poribacteria bacterium]